MQQRDSGASRPQRTASDGDVYDRVQDLDAVIREQKRAEQALRESEERYRSLVESSPDMIGVHRGGEILYINSAGAEMLGVERPDELVGRSLIDFVHPAYRTAVADCIRRAERDGEALPAAEQKLVRSDGEVLDVEVVGRTILYRGEPASQLVVRDITERKRAEAALSASEARFRALVENVSDAITLLDPDGTIRYVSPALERITGYAAHERVGRSAFERVHPEDVENARRAWRQVLETPGGSVSIQPRIRHRNGEWRSIELVGKNLLDDPAIRGIVVTYHDVTERRNLEEQLRQAQKIEAVGRLAGGVAHDFNNMLTTIRGHAEFLLDATAAGDPLREDAEEIVRAADRAARLTQQLLLFSRQQMVQPEVLDLNATVAEMERMLRRLIGEDIGLETVLAGDLGAVVADPGHVHQVLMNLVVNARDAMPGGGRITITTRSIEVQDAAPGVHDRIEPGRYAMLAVSDTGTGMDHETLERIFEPFFTTKELGKGTGLGLSTVYGIVKQSDGHIRVESEPGTGTTFEIYLPQAPDVPDAAVRMKPARTSAEGGFETILIVEDEAPVRALIRKVLERQGYRVLEAGSGEAAIGTVERHDGPIDLVLTDIVMPEMGGRELAERLGRSNPDTHVIFMSGYTQDEVLRRGVREASVSYLEKPFSPADLARKVREALDRPRAS